MSSTLTKPAAAPERGADTLPSAPQPPRKGPSRRRRRANHKLGNVVAICAMGAWAVVGLMPVVAALYAIYGY